MIIRLFKKQIFNIVIYINILQFITRPSHEFNNYHNFEAGLNTSNVSGYLEELKYFMKISVPSW